MCFGYDYKESNKKQNETRKMSLSEAKARKDKLQKLRQNMESLRKEETVKQS